MISRRHSRCGLACLSAALVAATILTEVRDIPAGTLELKAGRSDLLGVGLLMAFGTDR